MYEGKTRNLEGVRKYPKRLINYGAYRHRPKFHRYTKTIHLSADEGQTGLKRVDVSMTPDPSKWGRGRPKKIRTENINICTNISFGSTPPQISPLFTTSQGFECQMDVIDV